MKHTKFISLILAIVLVCTVLTGCGDNKQAADNTAAVSTDLTETQQQNVESALSEYLSDEDPVLQESEKINVSDLSITEGLPSNVKNILMLGTDARNNLDNSRSDTMIICSINTETDKVKLTSIMRDTAIKVEGKGNVRINAANYYGGPKLAMKIVNECFGLNIQDYVLLNFRGFEVIADALGGVDVNLTEQELEHVNHNVKEQILIDIKNGGISYEDGEKEYYDTLLKTFGANTHLNGRQTLGYARIRKIDSDYARAERQRVVLQLLMNKLKEKASDASSIMGLAAGLFPYVQTNMQLNDIITIALSVLNSENFSNAAEFRVPVQGSYSEERRNDDAMLWDTDFERNTKELHAFIYGQ